MTDEATLVDGDGTATIGSDFGLTWAAPETRMRLRSLGTLQSNRLSATRTFIRRIVTER